jgi:hypothetical protein
VPFPKANLAAGRWHERFPHSGVLKARRGEIIGRGTVVVLLLSSRRGRLKVAGPCGPGVSIDPFLQLARIFRPTHTLEPPGRNPIARSRHGPPCRLFLFVRSGWAARSRLLVTRVQVTRIVVMSRARCERSSRRSLRRPRDLGDGAPLVSRDPSGRYRSPREDRSPGVLRFITIRTARAWDSI